MAYRKRRLTVSGLVQRVQEILDVFSISRDINRAEIMIQNLADLTKRHRPGPKLSKATKDIDRLLLEGKKPKEISDNLKVSLSTVRRRQTLSRMPKEKVDGTSNVDEKSSGKAGQESGNMA